MVRLPPAGLEGREVVRGSGAIAVGIVDALFPRGIEGAADRGPGGMDGAHHGFADFSAKGDASSRFGKGADHGHPVRCHGRGHFLRDAIRLSRRRLRPVEGHAEEPATRSAVQARIRGGDGNNDRRGNRVRHGVDGDERLPSRAAGESKPGERGGGDDSGRVLPSRWANRPAWASSAA